MTSRFLPKFHFDKRLLLLIATILFFSFLSAVSFAGNTQLLSVISGTSKHDFTVEIMRTPEERSIGLMHRQQLDAKHGMLFDFGGAVIARMWMKNTYIPLDMLFIREDGAIANIAFDTVPHSTEVISSEGDVRYVLEINAGISKRLGIKAGDHVDLP